MSRCLLIFLIWLSTPCIFSLVLILKFSTCCYFVHIPKLQLTTITKCNSFILQATKAVPIRFFLGCHLALHFSLRIAFNLLQYLGMLTYWTFSETTINNSSSSSSWTYIGLPPDLQSCIHRLLATPTVINSYFCTKIL